MAESNKEWVLAQALDSLEGMSSAVSSAFGLEGRATLAQSTSGIVITRSGSHILDLAFPTNSDPVASLVLKSVSDFHDKFGDGVKSLVIMLNTLLKQISTLKMTYVVNKLSNFQVELEQCFSKKNCACELSESTLKSVIQTFFATRFTLVVSETLSQLVFEWVNKLSSITEVKMYLNNFSILCVKFSPYPISSSTVQTGLLIKGLYSRQLLQSAKKCVLKVYFLSPDITPNKGEVEADILEIISEESQEEHIVFVTNIFLEDRPLFLLNSRNIFFIHSVCLDTTKFLFETYCDLEVECALKNEFLWVLLPDVFQLLLKAPNPTISAEYADGISDCLKMLNNCFKSCFCTVPAGGCFEHVVAKTIFSFSNPLGPKIPPVKGRNQLLVWVKPLENSSDLLKHFDLKRLENVNSEIVNLICPALMSIVCSKNYSNNISGLEPLSLRLAVLSKAISMSISLCKLDGVVVKQKKGRMM